MSLKTALAAGLLAASVLAAPPASADVPFASAVFRATHNSYSGNFDGAKGSITAQLDSGVRFVEFDIHDNDYGTSHDYAVGHDSPGNLVDHNGNPASNALRDWLRVVDSWSDAHPSHAPIVVMLDLKDDLTDNPSYAAGNLAAVNQELTDVFGAGLATPAQYPSLPSVDSLRGRVLPLLSGNGTTRAAYRRDTGASPAIAVNGKGQVVEVHDSGSGTLWYWTGTYGGASPAIAVNGKGQVVEVHDSGSGTLWYWTGTYGADGRITWLRHGKYDTGKTPAIALADNGDLVEVHQSQTATTLWSHVGKLGADGEITWGPSKQYDNGVLPTVAFTGSGTVREVHQSQSGTQNWQWTGTLSGSSVTWSGNAKTADPRYDKTTSRGVVVWTGADGATPAQTLRYSTPSVGGARIQYPQVAFDEYQDGDSAELRQGAVFYAAPATHSSFIADARRAGYVVRGWDFDSASLATDPLANYPATNHPRDSWYLSLTADAVTD
ncbi:Ca2+-dependent phosphoinositide-specific phospholipase C [Amycolatopsis dongchuanensis]|uniref:Phosphoinositide phospholipase C, Ca2+-dependent n=1 Tax=Amycolatopsis dongchuanensis TaxID=1070866 RepID=A0ABP8VRH2_9PSEU